MSVFKKLMNQLYPKPTGYAMEQIGREYLDLICYILYQTKTASVKDIDNWRFWHLAKAERWYGSKGSKW